MRIKTFGVAAATAALVAFPLAACGSSTPAPVVTVTATPTLAPCPPVSDPGWEKCFDAHRAQRDAAAKQPSSTAPAQPKADGLPWWAWFLIVPTGLALLGVLGFKLMEANDERTISRAEARVAELDARPRPVLDYDDYERDEDEDDELDEEDMSFLDKVTDPAPSSPAQPAPPASGSLLSSLRQQGGVQ
ncbi:putative lipoprotein [Mycobacteroides abscessus subsp. abscessus]|uniref:hypothetical protein n=1 Tax=Mycobacteroides abscessus TaxID=36809 RepID=UPI00092BA0E0|nr:hypothetical protein [Mycobacteroides abscessus]SID53480.1 putative lipoprotein [Mycobacteroides abscessus subsp. abscessus]SIH39425.1 putative lipoprotein [Mycobacteroides abscessus subsp. abscessus]